MFPRERLLFGTAYYPEYRPDSDPVADLALMQAAGITTIRVGESVWSTWEPEDGVFDLDWLQPTLDAAHARGIGVILGTPTYAVPMWLARRYPEIALAPATGDRAQWGARQEMDVTHAAFRFHAERVIRAVVTRYRDHPAIVGYQVDNEPGLRLLYNDGVFEAFLDRLRREYGDVETLNDAWGLTYWSHRLTTWNDLWRPDGNRQPQYDLAWRRFQADLVTDYIGWQADIVRELVGPEPFLTTCISYEQPGVEDVDLSARLSVASGNVYYASEDALAVPTDAPAASGETGWIVRGAWAVTQLADLMYSSRQEPFLVTETNAGSIGFSMLNQSPYDGQWTQIAWLLVGRGARMIEYWHWNSLAAGAETYWGGILPHSGTPGRVYRELARLGQQLGRAGDAFADAEPEYDIAVLWDSDSKFALAAQPSFADGWTNPDAYRELVGPFSRGIFEAGRQQRLVRPQQILPSRGGQESPAALAARMPVLVAAGWATPSDADLDHLAAYARAGGHLVLGPRSAGGDREARARLEELPARLVAAAGASRTEAANPREPIALDADAGLSGAVVSYLELLEPDGAEVLARYRHPHFGRWAAVTTHAVGAGRVTLVGGVPDRELARTLAAWLAPTPVAGWRDLPASVTVSTSRTPGGRVHVVHNWAWEPARASAPADLTDLLNGDVVPAGATLELGAWDVRVLVEGSSR